MRIRFALLTLLTGLTTAGATVPLSAQTAAARSPATPLTLPLKPGSLRFAVIGDAGTGTKEQYDVARQMEVAYQSFPFEFVLMTGDNIYGSDTAADMKKKFEDPYAFFHQKGIRFYAALGNHDSPNQRFYELYNMNGERFYTYKPRDGARFFALDSNYLEGKQLAWLEKELAGSSAEWKIAFFHHPLYSSGRTHGSSIPTREVLEPILVKLGVNIVLTGHDHLYERTKPQQGIVHFVVGASGKLRKGDDTKAAFQAKGYDRDLSFLLMEIAGDELFFQALSRTGQTIDSGVLSRAPSAVPAAP